MFHFLLLPLLSSLPFPSPPFFPSCYELSGGLACPITHKHGVNSKLSMCALVGLITEEWSFKPSCSLEDRPNVRAWKTSLESPLPSLPASGGLHTQLQPPESRVGGRGWRLSPQCADLRPTPLSSALPLTCPTFLPCNPVEFLKFGF